MYLLHQTFKRRKHLPLHIFNWAPSSHLLSITLEEGWTPLEVLPIYFAMKQEQTFLILFRIAILPDGSLRILNASKSDEGKYICQGENIFGSAEIIASLSVKGKITGNMPDVPQSCLPSLGIRGRKLNAIACTCVCIDWCECLGLNFF